MQNSAKDKIILALDVPSAEHARRLIELVGDRVGIYKIGLQLFTQCGPAIVREVQASGAKVFLDLKLHDIPNTVAHAVEAAASLGVHMLTIHLSGGREMAEAAQSRSGQTLILGVTVLTSSNDETLRETGIQSPVEEQVLRLAGIAKDLAGVVCSPLEIAPLREKFSRSLRLVTPGVRPTWAAAGDQKRILTPAQALQAGADYLVIGRPITAAPDPAQAAERILEEINAA